MNNSISKLKLVTASYKKILIPLLLIVATFMIIFLVILPQISSISEKFAQIDTQKKQLATLKNSQNTINNASTTSIDADFDTVTHALPIQKDITLIFDALTKAASESQTNVDSFTVMVGGIYGRAAQEVGTVGNPAIGVTSHVSGSTEGLVTFTKALEKELPLSEIKKISITGGEATFEINFFYKPVNAASIAKQDDVKPLNQTQKNTLNTLKEWE